MNYTLRRIPQFFLKMHRKERFMGVHSVQGAHPHTAAPLVVTALPRVITHGREKNKRKCLLYENIQEASPQKETLGPLLRKNKDKVTYNTYFT